MDDEAFFHGAGRGGVLGGTWSVWGVTGWYLVILSQYRAVLAGIWWYWITMGQDWVIMGRYWLILGDTASV